MMMCQIGRQLKRNAGARLKSRNPKRRFIEGYGKETKEQNKVG